MNKHIIPCLAIVVPCYNEEDALPSTVAQITRLLNDLIVDGLAAKQSTITFIDDGSTDSTWHLISQASRENNGVHGIKLSRNFGHQQALLAGLLNADGDAIISLDADLQDDLTAIREMLFCYRDGYQVVYGVRVERKSDSYFKKMTAFVYYKSLIILGAEIVSNHADYRLLSRVAVNALKSFGEANIFLRGVIPKLGFKSTYVYYKRQERVAGESKYPILKMLGFAWEGMTSLSPMPLRLITILGLIVSFCSFLGGMWVIAFKLHGGNAVPGWASILVPIFFLGGVQILSLGIIGEYIYKIFLEAKNRPRFIIEEAV